MKTTIRTGDVAELFLTAVLVSKGFTVLKPVSAGCRFDLYIFETQQRVQCKSARLKNGSLQFPTCSVDNVTQKRRTYHGDIELFGVYSPDLMKAYLIPLVDATNKAAMCLRVTPATNGQAYRNASDYELTMGSSLEVQALDLGSR